MAIRDNKKKKVNNHEEEEAKDRLSDLSDNLLLHILSLLPQIKLAVRTCVLSKRWKYMWASLPDLTFCESKDRPPLEEVVGRVLSGRNNAGLRKLCFRYLGDDNSLITRVISYAMSHNVQHLIISLYSPSLRILLPLLNAYCSLKTLELERFSELFLLRDISLHKLTTLHISSSIFCPLHSTKVVFDPFVGLVNLKSLKLIDCGMHGARGFKISGPQLHSLTLCRYSSSPGCKVEVFAPKLHSFEFIGTNPVEFANLDFPLLETANVDADLVDPTEKSHWDLIKMFQGLYHAQSLYLSSATIKSLMGFPGLQASPFGRLKTLNIKYPCKGISIPNTVMNYFGFGGGTSLNINIEIEKKRRRRKS